MVTLWPVGRKVPAVRARWLVRPVRSGPAVGRRSRRRPPL